MVLVALVGLLSVAGCAAAAEPAEAYEQADVRFSQQMITHHRETIQLAELGAERGNAYVKELSGKIIPAEQADIKTMSGWLTSWKEQIPAEAEAAKRGSELPAGSGFERGWLTLLSGHLEHGIHMAKEVQSTGKHQPTRSLADRIVREQGEQLAEIGKRLA